MLVEEFVWAIWPFLIGIKSTSEVTRVAQRPEAGRLGGRRAESLGEQAAAAAAATVFKYIVVQGLSAGGNHAGAAGVAAVCVASEAAAVEAAVRWICQERTRGVLLLH